MAVSDRVKSGPEKAPHRSLWKALGLTDEELKLPLIGVVSAKSECVPGHNHLNNIAQAVKDGIRLAGGVPVEFPAIGVCDGIAMGHVGMKYSLASRELIADSCESMAMAHGFDGMVFIPNCDKIVPGMLMAARRLNLPAMVISGGPMMPGRMPGGSGDMDLNSVFEAVGAYKAGKMDDAQLNAVESSACPGCGSCSGSAMRISAGTAGTAGEDGGQSRVQLCSAGTVRQHSPCGGSGGRLSGTLHLSPGKRPDPPGGSQAAERTHGKVFPGHCKIRQHFRSIHCHCLG